MLCGYLFTHYLIRIAHQKQLLDVANHRSSHTQATPRIGGISFVVIISFVFCGATFFLEREFSTRILLFSLFPAVAVATTGLIDDITGLSQRTRLLVYWVCSVLVLGNASSMLLNQPLWLMLIDGIALSAALTWLTNLFNFMDGIDGIAASQGVFILIALAYFSYTRNGTEFSTLLIYSCAPLLGFLFVNWSPARIFMGDIGSTFLGSIIGSLILLAIHKSFINIYAAFILLGCFSVDATWTLCYRIFTGQHWYQAHRSHSYQILSRRMGSHQRVTLLYGSINMFWLFPLAQIAQNYSQHALLITTIALLPLCIACFIIGAGKVTSN